MKAARQASDEAKALAQTIVMGGFIDHHIAYSLGAMHAQLGELAEAGAGSNRRPRTGLPCYPWFSRDPLLDPLRRDPQFVQFVTGLEDSWRKLIVRYTSGTR